MIRTLELKYLTICFLITLLHYRQILRCFQCRMRFKINKETHNVNRNRKDGEYSVLYKCKKGTERYSRGKQLIFNFQRWFWRRALQFGEWCVNFQELDSYLHFSTDIQASWVIYIHLQVDRFRGHVADIHCITVRKGKIYSSSEGLFSRKICITGVCVTIILILKKHNFKRNNMDSCIDNINFTKLINKT